MSGIVLLPIFLYTLTIAAIQHLRFFCQCLRQHVMFLLLLHTVIRSSSVYHRVQCSQLRDVIGRLRTVLACVSNMYLASRKHTAMNATTLTTRSTRIIPIALHSLHVVLHQLKEGCVAVILGVIVVVHGTDSHRPT